MPTTRFNWQLTGSFARGATGKARVDHLVATKSPQVVTQEYTVSPADLKMTEKLSPLVREAMREGIYLPNRGSSSLQPEVLQFR